MAASLRLSVPDLGDPLQREDFFAVAEAAAEADGTDPFDEQALLDLTAGRRSPVCGIVTGGPADGRTVAAAILGRGELAVAVDPLFRGMHFGEKSVEGLLATTRGPLTAWSHGDHPAARRLAERFGFEPIRTLLRLTADVAPAEAVASPPGFTIEGMRPGADDEEWVDLNARIFADHPEQGRLTVDDLRARQAEPWFDADDVLLLRDEHGRLYRRSPHARDHSARAERRPQDQPAAGRQKHVARARRQADCRRRMQNTPGIGLSSDAWGAVRSPARFLSNRWGRDQSRRAPAGLAKRLAGPPGRLSNEGLPRKPPSGRSPPRKPPSR